MNGLSLSTLVSIALALLIAIDLVQCFGVNYWKFRKHVEKEQKKRAERYIKEQFFTTPSLLLGPPFPDQYFEQSLDHFDPSVKGTYKQRFWVNTDHWTKPHGPVFLYIGGEGALSSLTVQAGEHVDLAKKYGALVVAVEHRYYGSSINEDSFQLKNMKYLSSQQALADLATFHAYASQQLHLSDKNTWICFGGSYPGALSAWFRVKYPHLVYGAIASSAPIRAKVNFQGYNNVVAASLSDPIVNGSLKCALNVKEAFKSVDLMLARGQMDELARDFHSCDPISTDLDVTQFAGNLADVFEGTVQYNAEHVGLNITGLCDYMTQPGEPYQNLIKLNAYFMEVTEQKCTDNSWENYIKTLSNTTAQPQIGVGIRQWLYQTCSQFGYYQTCDNDTMCPFSRHMTLGSNLEMCRRVFEISPDEVYHRVDFTNDYYGSDQPRGTRIVFVNGSVDPWHALGVLADISATETAIYIEGTAHCANMGINKSYNPPALQQARKEIEQQIGQWLVQAGKGSSMQADDNTLYFRSHSN